MKNYYLILFLSILPLIATAQETINATLTHNGQERSYIMYVPASYNPATPSPLVLCFHGYTSSANTIMSYSGFNTIADTANFIVVYPQGTLLDGVTHWNVGGWTINSTTDDVGFTNALLDSISADYTIDSSKVYSTGMSNGGFMSFLLACQLSERIAAIASITGSMTPETYSACDPQHPMPILQIHGTSDGTVPYNGAFWTKSISEVLAYWVAFDNTNTSPSTASIDNTNTVDGSTAERISYAAGDSCSAVTHYKITGGDHTWPGAWGNMDINASKLVWEFFSHYDINGKANCEEAVEEEEEDSTEEEGEPEITAIEEEDLKVLKVYPNPSSTYILVEGISTLNSTYVISSVEGKVILKGFLKANSHKIDIAALQQGVYIVKIGQQSLKIIKQD